MSKGKKTFKIVALRELGRRIQYLRKHYLRLKQHEFARELNLAESTIQNWEAGKLPAGEKLERDLTYIIRRFKLNGYENWLKFGQGEPPRRNSSLEVDIKLVQEIQTIIEDCYELAGKSVTPERKLFLINVFYPMLKSSELQMETLRTLLPNIIKTLAS